jgi:ubiquinone biosynthesis monooxygenase Coq7
LNAVDRGICAVDGILRSITRVHQAKPRPSPAHENGHVVLADVDRRLAAELMRVNHAGEVCAQALYLGQGVCARDSRIRRTLRQSAVEEIDHLYWCEARLRALRSHPSRLRPVWFAGSLAIGIAAGLAGDRWSLGFLAETERQVVLHLEKHLRTLPVADAASRRVVVAMRDEEARHAMTAIELGGAELPEFVRRLMRRSARVMTTAARYL